MLSFFWRIWRQQVRLKVLFAFATAMGVLMFSYHYLDTVARARPVDFRIPLIEELTGSYAGAAMFPLVLWAARRWPVSWQWWRVLLPHLSVVAVCSGLHTTGNWLLRVLLFPLAGLGTYDYGHMPTRYLMEAPHDVIGYGTILAFVALFDRYQASRDREVRAARLERELAEAHLENLRLQLQPHFLFNALNTISAIMYDDPRAADVMISRLSDFLRATLQASTTPEVKLRQELALTDLYLHIMRARFADRLSVQVEVERGLEEALVPQLLLQPLVENAIRHGADPRTAAVHIAISARREQDALQLQVRDTGRGLPGGAREGGGLGLANTARRLDRLYGAQHELRLENAENGGTVVTVRVPLHRAAREE